MNELTNAVLMAVSAERNHQDEENGPDHDDAHEDGELALAAAEMLLEPTDFHMEKIDGEVGNRFSWGYADKYSNNRKRQLLIAAALCVAELERILRGEQVRSMQRLAESRFKLDPGRLDGGAA